MNLAESVQELTSPSFITRGQFWPSGIVVACVCVSVCSCVRVCVSITGCPRDNSPLVQPSITKLGAQVQKTLAKVPIVLGVDQP